jgi:hypothetical protein
MSLLSSETLDICIWETTHLIVLYGEVFAEAGFIREEHTRVNFRSVLLAVAVTLRHEDNPDLVAVC